MNRWGEVAIYQRYVCTIEMKARDLDDSYFFFNWSDLSDLTYYVSVKQLPLFVKVMITPKYLKLFKSSLSLSIIHSTSKIVDQWPYISYFITTTKLAHFFRKKFRFIIKISKNIFFLFILINSNWKKIKRKTFHEKQTRSI